MSVAENSRARALQTIAQHRQSPLGHFIDGRPVLGEGAVSDVLEPATGEVLGQVRDATSGELDAAVAAAKAAFQVWSRTPGEQRKTILHKVADLIEQRADQIAEIECLDAGQCWRFMSKAAVRGAENFRFF